LVFLSYGDFYVGGGGGGGGKLTRFRFLSAIAAMTTGITIATAAITTYIVGKDEVVWGFCVGVGVGVCVGVEVGVDVGVEVGVAV
jgi:hypothetical protein